MTWITTNHKSLQITTNHDINHHEPWQKPAQSMTWITTNHHKPSHEPSWWPKKSSASSHMASLLIPLMCKFLSWTGAKYVDPSLETNSSHLSSLQKLPLSRGNNFSKSTNSPFSIFSLSNPSIWQHGRNRHCSHPPNCLPHCRYPWD